MSDNTAIVKDINYAKSNILIGAKFSSSLMENKLMALALSEPGRMVADAGGTIRVTIPANEIRMAFGGNEGSFYHHLKKTAQEMNNRQIGIVSEDSGQFAFYQIIQTAVYDNQELKITFNSDLSKYIKDLTESFTLLNLPVMLSFRSTASFRLYELLRARTYNRSKSDPNSTWTLEFDLYELYLQLGVVDSEDDKAKKILGGEKKPDYKKAVEAADNKKVSLLDWSSFRRNILLKAIDEINEKTELNVEFTPIRGGYGGKVRGVIFNVSKETNSHVKDVAPVKKKLSDDDKMDFIDALRGVFGEFASKDLRTIAESSDYDIDRCKKAFEVYRAADRAKIDNPVGFIVKAIRENWSSHSKANAFTQFEQNSYNYEEIEKLFVINNN
jgi:plasmid replication initiation protein